MRMMLAAIVVILSHLGVSVAESVDGGAAPAGATSGGLNATQGPDSLDEIVVTAQKRSERLMDVPIPVSVLAGGALADSNQVRLADYYTNVPGLSMAPSTMSTQTLSIRGITTGAVAGGPPNPSPTVGITVDDVPFGGTGGGDTLVPDFDPGDLTRIEVLRGPQGTLYGASSMGGLIKYVTTDPSTDQFSGRIEGGTESVQNAAGLGYIFRGSVNVPLSSNLAVRGSFFGREDPGYIDDPIVHIDGVNEDHANGGHLAVLWQPAESFSLKLSALYQSIKGDGTNDVTPNPPATTGAPALGDLQQYYIRAVGPYERDTQAYSAVLTDKIGSIELTSLSGYNIYSVHDSLDWTSFLGEETQTYFGTSGTALYNNVNFNRFTQEIRGSSPLGQHVDGLLGIFYSHEADRYKWNILASDPASGVTAGDWGTLNSTNAPITYSEYAAFADVTYHITDRVDVQLGARESQYRIVGEALTDTGLFNTAVLGLPSENVVIFPEYTVKQNAFTYLLTPRFKISSDLMIYARLASGYRPGGSNAGTPGVPTEYRPDKTRDYEIGAKGDFLERTLSVDASIYYIDWTNIQLNLVDPSNDFGYVGNAAAAKSEGLELSVDSRPVNDLTIGAWVALTDAVLTQTVPGAGENGVLFGFAGDRLPNTARFSGNLSINEDFPALGETSPFLAGSLSYVGDRLDTFPTASPQRQYLPPYAKTDLRAGLKMDSWTLNVFVNNVADKRGLIAGGIGNVIPYAFYYIQPRTVGVSVSKAFRATP